MSVRLSPFWQYFGGKYRIAPRYPKPAYRTIIEPFAGAAGYSMRHHTRDVILVEKYDVVYGIWDFLIHAKRSEIECIPLVRESIEEVPSWVPKPMRDLIGFRFVGGIPRPSPKIGAWMRPEHKPTSAWNEAARALVASQVEHIRHWKVIHGSYEQAPEIEATWFIDPPYIVAGEKYVHGADAIDFGHLGAWCRTRPGQVTVCENDGASWLPFRPFLDINGAPGEWQRKKSTEAIWTTVNLPRRER